MIRFEKQRYFDAYYLSAHPLGYRDHGGRGPAVCGVSPGGGAGMVADSPCLPHRLWGFPLSELFHLCRKSVSDRPGRPGGGGTAGAGGIRRPELGKRPAGGGLRSAVPAAASGAAPGLRPAAGCSSGGVCRILQPKCLLAGGLCSVYGAEGGPRRHSLDPVGPLPAGPERAGPGPRAAEPGGGRGVLEMCAVPLFPPVAEAEKICQSPGRGSHR